MNVLFLCTHNSARSILAEALLNHLAQGRFRAYSAGSQPREHPVPHPLALEALVEAGVATEGLSSKSWDVFAVPDAPRMDLVITVCDQAAGEACPFWPGQPATAHWGFADPSATEGTPEEKRAAFRHTLGLIRARLERFLAQPVDGLQPAALQATARALAREAA